MARAALESARALSPLIPRFAEHLTFDLDLTAAEEEEEGAGGEEGPSEGAAAPKQGSAGRSGASAASLEDAWRWLAGLRLRRAALAEQGLARLARVLKAPGPACPFRHLSALSVSTSEDQLLNGGHFGALLKCTLQGGIACMRQRKGLDKRRRLAGEWSCSVHAWVWGDECI